MWKWLGSPGDSPVQSRCRSVSGPLCSTALAALFGLAWAGCAQTVVKSEYESAKSRLQRPSRIFVYDFAVTREQVKENQGLLQGTVNDVEGTTTFEHEGEIANEVRGVAAEEMVKAIQNLGLPAERVPAGTPVPPGALAITGQFLNVDEGNKGARMVIGLGMGQSHVDIRVQMFGYGLDPAQPSDKGPIKLVEFETHADSGSMPGALVTGGAGLAAGAATGAVVGANVAMGGVKSYRSSMGSMTARSVEQAADYLSEFFGRQGWIRPDKVKYADRP